MNVALFQSLHTPSESLPLVFVTGHFQKWSESTFLVHLIDNKVNLISLNLDTMALNRSLWAFVTYSASIS
jgi:hypothetical protein